MLDVECKPQNIHGTEKLHMKPKKGDKDKPNGGKHGNRPNGKGPNGNGPNGNGQTGNGSNGNGSKDDDENDEDISPFIKVVL